MLKASKLRGIENFIREEHQSIVGISETSYGFSQKYQVWLGFLAHFYPNSLQI